jgi:UDPglucose--hexose-1-phosphate uridylyltransferase
MTEFRRDPITGRCVIVVPGRSARPNEHAVDAPSTSADPNCPFCEGNEARTPPEVAVVAPPGRQPNERGWYVRTIPNRFPTVAAELPETEPRRAATGFESRPAFGYHEVVIESPTHAPLLPFLPGEQVARVIRACRARVRALSERSHVGSVTLFENAGPESGGSLWHPHAQLVTVPGLTPSLQEEVEGAERYRLRSGGDCAFDEVRHAEVRDGSRLLFDSGGFVAFAPFASAYPFEVRVLPSRHSPSFGDATDDEVDALADRLPALLRALLALVPGASYNLVVRTPVGPSPTYARYHWHLDLYPRLVRPDGFDIGSGLPVNTVTPEDAAVALRTELGAKR